ncbi:apolipoprotein N-acyltransferase [Pseudooceanicola nanhaiensis]|jgi:apolipoprotein N-acyltransferase|uniref:Apolipoprotein N-acyltransferase n=1 Tax=Pseudooceanicola nanhaiensis TaxID=375761 RepID=A0A917T1K8_9RHOB|nr:apolipoprotein N-acyltransferase [Pseudooceanicola nanhaiensis]GGM05698.1 apolipoprotein N-acyltransferase [Pseudooceanicola nanhaiensis]
MPDTASAVRRPLWRDLGLAAGFGAVAALGLAPFNLWPLALFALAGVVWRFDRAPSVRRAAWAGWAAGTGYFLVALNWIVEPFLIDIARHGWMAPFALIFMAGGLALFWAAGSALAQWIAPRGRMRLPAFVAALTLAELVRGVIFTGFPWAQIGHVLIGSPLIQVAAWTGPGGLTLLALALAAALSRVPAQPLRAGVPLVIVTGGLILTAPALAPKPPETPGDAPVLRLMQPNAPQREKWDPEKIGFYFNRMLDYSAQAPAVDVAIWPETSVPAFLDDADQILSVIAERAQGAVSVIGIERREDWDYFNSLAVLQPDGAVSEVYDKHHLVPFGEYLPQGALLSRLGLAPIVDRFGGFTPGEGPRAIDLGPAGRAIPLICYEAVFPAEIRSVAERPDVLLQITNDAWFGTFSGPYQHFAQARLRAVEQGLPMVRVANTGISAVIAADGTTIAALPLGETGYLDVPRPAAAAPTLYARIGSWPLLGLVILVLVSAFAARRGQMHTTGH